MCCTCRCSSCKSLWCCECRRDSALCFPGARAFSVAPLSVVSCMESNFIFLTPWKIVNVCRTLFRFFQSLCFSESWMLAVLTLQKIFWVFSFGGRFGGVWPVWVPWAQSLGVPQGTPRLWFRMDHERCGGTNFWHRVPLKSETPSSTTVSLLHSVGFGLLGSHDDAWWCAVWGRLSCFALGAYSANWLFKRERKTLLIGHYYM